MTRLKLTVSILSTTPKIKNGDESRVRLRRRNEEWEDRCSVLTEWAPGGVTVNHSTSRQRRWSWTICCGHPCIYLQCQPEEEESSSDDDDDENYELLKKTTKFGGSKTGRETFLSVYDTVKGNHFEQGQAACVRAAKCAENKKSAGEFLFYFYFLKK